MFKIEYKIPQETKDNIHDWSIEKFEEEIGEVEGQIKLNFNGKIYGCIDEDDSLFNNRYLIMWFSRLNECCNILKTSDYASFDMPETNNLWMEMNVKDDDVYIQRSKLISEVLTCFVVDCPFEDFKYFDWKNTVIRKSEFIDEIDVVTRKFIYELYDLKSEILNIRSLNKLLKICNWQRENII